MVERPPGGLGIFADGSKTAVEPTECTCEHDRHDEDAGRQGEHVLRLAQIEGPDAAHQHVSDGEVEKPPQHVDERRGQPFSWPLRPRVRDRGRGFRARLTQRKDEDKLPRAREYAFLLYTML